MWCNSWNNSNLNNVFLLQRFHLSLRLQRFHILLHLLLHFKAPPSPSASNWAWTQFSLATARDSPSVPILPAYKKTDFSKIYTSYKMNQMSLFLFIKGVCLLCFSSFWLFKTMEFFYSFMQNFISFKKLIKYTFKNFSTSGKFLSCIKKVSWFCKLFQWIYWLSSFKFLSISFIFTISPFFQTENPKNLVFVTFSD